MPGNSGPFCRCAPRFLLGFVRSHILDIAIGAALFAMAFLLAASYLFTWGGKTDYYQNRLAPAVMLASGRGFLDVSPAQVPGLQSFLEEKSNYFSASDIPELLNTSPPNAWHRAHRYQYYLIACIWRLFGISWTSLYPLFGLFYGISTLLIYAIFRIYSNRLLSVTGALILLTSPTAMAMLPYFRDYSIAPFMLAEILIIILLVKFPPAKGRTILLAVAGGVIAGIGSGFRQDFIVCIPIMLAVYLFLVPLLFKRCFKLTVSAAGIFLLLYVILSYPTKPAGDEGSNTYQFILAGMMKPYDALLGVENEDYAFGPYYSDEQVGLIVNAYAFLKDGNGDSLAHRTAGYDKYTSELFYDILRRFPADILIRAYASTFSLFDTQPIGSLVTATELQAQYYIMPPGTRNSTLISFYKWRTRFVAVFWGYTKYIVVLLLVVMAFKNIRMALVYTLLLLYFCGHQALQFDARHFFYLEFIPWIALAIATSRGWQYVNSGFREWRASSNISCLIRSANISVSQMLQGSVFVVAVLLAFTVPLFLGRAYQQRMVIAMITQILDGDVAEIHANDAVNHDGAMPIPDITAFAAFDIEAAGPAVSPEYWVARFRASGLEPGKLGLQYQSDLPHNNLSSEIAIPHGETSLDADATVSVFFPVYNASKSFFGSWRRLTGITLSEGTASNLIGVYRVKHPEMLPFLPFLIVSPDWRNQDWYQAYVGQEPPLYARAQAARRTNIIPNGDMENWPLDSAAPTGFSSHSLEKYTIQRELVNVSHGSQAVRQTWMSFDGNDSIFNLFHTEVSGLVPGETYELIIAARNLSKKTPIRISAWQTWETDQGTRLERIALDLIVVKPNDGLSTLVGKFVSVGPEHSSVVFAASMQGDAGQDDVEVIWDDWRLSPCKP